jgi:hypothetical protein
LLEWAAAAHRYRKRVPAYSRALEMIDQTVAMTPTADMQHQAFAAAPDGLCTIAMEAAAVAITDG